MRTKKGKLPASRRYNLLPLLPSGPDGVQRELIRTGLALWRLPNPGLDPLFRCYLLQFSETPVFTKTPILAFGAHILP